MAAGGMRRTGLSLGIDGAREFKETLAEINRKLKLSQAELAKVTNAFGANERSVETLTAQKNHLTNAMEANSAEQRVIRERLEAATEALGENHAEVQKLQVQLANAEAGGVALARQMDELTAALDEQERAIRGQSWTELGRKMDEAGQRMQAVGSRMQSIGRGLSLKVTAPILAIGTAAVAVGADFMDTMGNIQATTGMTADAIDELGREFRSMAVSGEYGSFTARQIADAFNGVAVSGMDVAESVDLMHYAIVLATARNVDLGQAAYFLGEYLRKVGKDSTYAEKYINLFAQASANANIGLGSLQSYMFRMTPAFEQFGASSEANIGILTRLYQAGIRGARLYTGMGTIMMDLATRGDATNAMLERFGVSLVDASGHARENKDILFDLAYTMANYENQTEMAGVVTDRFNQTQQEAWFEFMNLSEEIRKEVIPSLYQATAAIDGTGAAFEMAAINQDGLVASTRQMRASLEEISLQIATHLLPHVQRGVEFIGTWIDRFASLDEGTQANIIRLAALAAAIGPVLVATGAVITATGQITTAFGKMSTAVGTAGGAKAFLAAKFPIITAGMTEAKNATIANTKAQAAATKSTAALTAGMGKNAAATATAATSKGLFAKALSIKPIAAYTSKMALLSAKMTAFASGMKTKAAGMGILKVGLTALTAGFVKLTAVMLANPIGAIVAGVALLAAGIALLVTRANRASAAYREMAEETERLTARQYELKEAAAGAAAGFRDNMTGIQRQAEHYRGLADSVARLSAQQRLSAGEMQTLHWHIEELNSSVPGLSLAFDEQTGALNMTVDAMNAYLAVAEQRTKLNAKRDEENRLRVQALELEAELMQVQEKREALELRIDENRPRRAADQRYLHSAISELVVAEENYRLALEANAEMHTAVTEGIGVHAEILRELETTQQETAESVAGLTAEMGNQARKAAQWEQAQSEALEKIINTYENFKSTATNAFSAVSQAAVLSMDEMAEILKNNKDAMRRWSSGIAILMASDIPPALIEPLIKAGAGAADQVDYMVKNIDQVIAELAPLVEEGMDIAADAMVNVLAGGEVPQAFSDLIDRVADTILENQGMEDALLTQISTAFDSMGDTISDIGFDGLGEGTVEGYLQGIENRMPDVAAAGQGTGETYAGALKGSLEQNSPSRVTERIGIGAVEGLIQGTEGKQPHAVQTAKDLARAFIDGIADKINSSPDIDDAVRRRVENIRRSADMAVINANFQSVGMEIASGVARGIDSGTGMVSNAATNMINNALNAMRAAADINSPSRKTRLIGQQLIDGMTGGLASKMDELAAYCERITQKVVDSLQIDTSGLITNAREVLYSMHSAIPALESNIHYTTGLHAAASPAWSPQIIVDMTRGHYYVREDADIDKIAMAVEKRLTSKTAYNSRVGGVILGS